MIRPISSNSVNNNNQPQKSEPNFKGLESLGTAVLNGATTVVQQCESNPMVNVAVLDLTTAIVPRTVVESQTNPYAGMEAFRRESSGLIINCMIPGVIVAGLALPLQRLIMGKGSDMRSCWANEDTINVIAEHWKKAPDVAGRRGLFADEKDVAKKTLKTKTYNTIHSILSETKGIDGAIKNGVEDSNLIPFKVHELEDSIKTIANNVAEGKSVDKAYDEIVKKTHISKHIKIGNAKDFHSQDLGSIIKDSPYIFRELANGAGLDADFVKNFAKKATKLVNYKSLMGLGVIIPLAIAAQPINRWITAKTSGKKGAPIYKDFENAQRKELTPKEKASLAKQKLISVSAMVGVALLSIMKKPNKEMFKSVTQFRGIFPSMDQARIIATATFTSRMMASEDKNDLREATVRDIATFSAFYFLGDYVAKGIAHLLQNSKKCKDNGIVLINELKKVPDGANMFKRFGYWAKHTALKSTDELPTAKAKSLRAACQLGNIGFSLLALGLFIPLWNRHQTDKKHEAELKAKQSKKT